MYQHLPQTYLHWFWCLLVALESTGAAMGQWEPLQGCGSQSDDRPPVFLSWCPHQHNGYKVSLCL